MVSILEGFEVVDLEESKGDSVMTLTATNLKFNKASCRCARISTEQNQIMLMQDIYPDQANCL